MLSAITPNFNKSTPSFEGANLKVENDVAAEISKYVEESIGKSLVNKEYILSNGKFNEKKLIRQLVEIFKDEPHLQGKYIVDSFKSVKGKAVARMKHLAEDGSEIKEDRFLFNPTLLITNNKSRFTEFLNDMLYYGVSPTAKQKIKVKHSIDFSI